MKVRNISYLEEGTPQGAVVSPLLSNIYLHEALDKWHVKEIRPHLKGRSFMIRFADDAILGFENQEEAEYVMKALKDRLAGYGLELHPEKVWEEIHYMHDRFGTGHFAIFDDALLINKRKRFYRMFQKIKDVEESFRFARDLGVTIHLSYYRRFPGQKISRRCKSPGRFRRPWIYMRPIRYISCTINPVSPARRLQISKKRPRVYAST